MKYSNPHAEARIRRGAYDVMTLLDSSPLMATKFQQNSHFQQNVILNFFGEMSFLIFVVFKALLKNKCVSTRKKLQS